MSDKVTEINLKKPNPDLVRQLKDMLALAENGTIVGWFGVAYYHDGVTSEHWMQTPPGYSTSIFGDRMVGCLERLKMMALCNRLDIDISEHIHATWDDDDDKGPE